MNKNYDIGFWRLIIMIVIALLLTWITITFIFFDAFFTWR